MVVERMSTEQTRRTGYANGVGGLIARICHVGDLLPLGMRKPCGNGGWGLSLDLQHLSIGPKANDTDGALLPILLMQMEGFGVLPPSDVPISLNEHEVNDAEMFNLGTSATPTVYLGHILVIDLVYAWRLNLGFERECIRRKAYGSFPMMYNRNSAAEVQMTIMTDESRTRTLDTTIIAIVHNVFTFH